MTSHQPIDLLVSEEQQTVLKSLSGSMQDIILNDRQICDFELLVTGVFSPLKGASPLPCGTRKDSSWAS